jgi:hypothetical protein
MVTSLSKNHSNILPTGHSYSKSEKSLHVVKNVPGVEDGAESDLGIDDTLRGQPPEKV